MKVKLIDQIQTLDKKQLITDVSKRNMWTSEDIAELYLLLDNPYFYFLKWFNQDKPKLAKLLGAIYDHKN